MRLLKFLGALVGISAVALAAPAGLSLDFRDEAKGKCGVTTVYVTAPFYVGGAYSMTVTRTSQETSFVTTTVGKSTTTDVVELTISSPISTSENAVIITASVVAPISSEISSSEGKTTTLKVLATRYLTRTIFATTNKINGDLEVNPVTIVEEPYSEITPVDVPGRTEIKSLPSSIRNRITRLTTWTNWYTESVRSTTTLPNGEVVVSSYISTNDASATMEMHLHDGSDSTPTPASSSPEPEETFDSNDEIVVVEITRVVEPLITLPPPAEIINTASAISSAEPSDSESPHAPFPVFTIVPVAIDYPTVIDEIDDNQVKDELTTTLSTTLSATISSTAYTDNNDAIETSVTSGDSSSDTFASSGNASVTTQTYSGAPYGWNNTYTTMTKVYVSAPGYGYEHLSQDYSADTTGPSASVQPSESSLQTESPITYTYSVPVYARTSMAQSEASVDPVESSLASQNHTTYTAYVKPGYGNGIYAGPVYGNGQPMTSVVFVSNSESGATSDGSSKPTSTIESVSNTDAVASSTAQYIHKPSQSSLFSHVVSNLPQSGSSVAVPSVDTSLSSLSHSSSAGSNATMTTASRDGDATTRPQITAPPSGLLAPSFLTPTATGSNLPILSSIATELLFEFPASIISLLSSSFAELTRTTASPDGDPTTRPQITASPSSLVAPSFLIPSITVAPSVSFTDVSSTSSSASSSASSCGEQGAFSLNFDDVPPLVGAVDQPLPLSSPYKHFYFSEGFAVGPPPRIPFVPESAPLILQFQTQSDVNVTRNDNFPAPGEYGATGEIGNGENLRLGCYSFDAVAAAVGCDSLGPDCEWQFTGVTYNSATGDYDEPYTQFARTPGCPPGQGCPLTDFLFLDNFKNIQSLRVNVTVEGVPKIWWMDDLQLKWSDGSCDAGNCRASHR